MLFPFSGDQLPHALKILLTDSSDELRGMLISSFDTVTLNFDNRSKFEKLLHKSCLLVHKWKLFMSVSTSSNNLEI